MSEFTQEYGAVLYDSNSSRKFVLDRQGECQMPGCEQYNGTSLSSGIIDHCHRHSLIRGILCKSCNRSMVEIDAGRIPIQHTRKGAPAYAQWRANCGYCIDLPQLMMHIPWCRQHGGNVDYCPRHCFNSISEGAIRRIVKCSEHAIIIKCLATCPSRIGITRIKTSRLKNGLCINTIIPDQRYQQNARPYRLTG
jgi:hypothetical protein